MKTYNFEQLKEAYRNPELRVKGFKEFNAAQEINAARYINILNHRYGSNAGQVSFITRDELLHGLFHGKKIPLSNSERLMAIANWIKENNGYYYSGDNLMNARRRGVEYKKNWVVLEKTIV